MKKRIRKAAVLGSGTMGSGIAAQLANAGIPSYLLDIVPKYTDADKAKGVDPNSPAFRNRIAENNKALSKNRQFMDKEDGTSLPAETWRTTWPGCPKLIG